ncbi:hypothetical protein [Duganella sp. BuS-21]|uniref:hypothetical protein n=1 Tax=Duganella sp. BuS-21 TaxID=2943848 RepID=UPI0035A71656
MILSSYPMWWLALPVLLLPVWWHRQKRQRLKAEPLATARFLPAATPEQLRVWQWRDKVLLVLRCLLLLALIAWLAATIFPWRGDTVLVDIGADKAWAEKEIAAAGFGVARRMDLPADVLQWLRQNERDWRPTAKLLIVARADQIAMPPRVPQFSHQLALRTQPPPAAAKKVTPVVRDVALGAPAARSGAWRSLFAAFDSAGTAAVRHTLAAEPSAGTTLIVWDTPDTVPPANWRAPHWWIAAMPAAFPELAKVSTLTINGITLKYADSPRGRLWTSDTFPPRDADAARALYEAWQLLAAAPAPTYATASQTFAAARNTPSAITDAKPATWLALALLALFMIERILTHARRH